MNNAAKQPGVSNAQDSTLRLAIYRIQDIRANLNGMHKSLSGKNDELFGARPSSTSVEVGSDAQHGGTFGDLEDQLTHLYELTISLNSEINLLMKV